MPVYGILIADEQLTSSDGRFKFVVQEDGNAVVYQGSTALWATNTAGHQPGWFTVGGNGNLGYAGPDDIALWGTQISGATGTNAKLVMQSDGNLVLSENGSVVWTSGTGGH